MNFDMSSYVIGFLTCAILLFAIGLIKSLFAYLKLKKLKKKECEDD